MHHTAPNTTPRQRRAFAIRETSLDESADIEDPEVALTMRVRARCGRLRGDDPPGIAAEARGIAPGIEIDLLDHAMPDIILMDAMMPGLDGFATTLRIKTDPRFAHTPVIFMTGLTESEHVVQGLEAGGVDYVSKPIIVDELIARLRVHLANARVTRGSQVALDYTGRPLVALDDEGQTLWCTPLGEAMLTAAFPGFAAGRTLPAPVV